MADKREKKRYPKRLKVCFGESEPDRLAYTSDVSEEGVFIKTAVPKFLNRHVLVHLTISEESQVLFEGRVKWAKRVPSAILHKHPKAGFGVCISRFISGEENFRRLIRDLNNQAAMKEDSTG